MSLFNAISSASTVIVLIVFIGIVAWAWSSNRKQDFDEASRLPLDDDEPTPPTS